MSKTIFELLVVFLGLGFALSFALIVLPALFETMDLPAAYLAGFVNPFSTGYSLDVIFSALILMVWVLYERIRYGWIAIPLCFFPGLAVGFAVYLIIRSRSLHREACNPSSGGS